MPEDEKKAAAMMKKEQHERYERQLYSMLKKEIEKYIYIVYEKFYDI